MLNIVGVVFFLCISFSAYAGCILYMPLCLVVQVLMPRYGRHLVDMFVGMWFGYAVTLYERVFKVKVRVTGDLDKVRVKDCWLAIMNHRTRLDWLFFFTVQSRFGSLQRFKIFLKRGLNHIPGAGWAMQAACFIFLFRKWQMDKDHIKRVLTYFRGLEYNPHMLLFPEGTDLADWGRNRNAEYAKKNNVVLPDYKYVLYPRFTGFVYTVKKLRKLRMFDQLLDVTVLYPQNIVQQETGIVFEGLPREIVFHLSVFEDCEIPKDETDLERWLLQRWELKEGTLKEFYENGSHAYKEQKHSVTGPFWYQAGCTTFWVISQIIFLYLLLTSLWAKVITCTLTVVFTLTSAFVGFEFLYI